MATSRPDPKHGGNNSSHHTGPVQAPSSGPGGDVYALIPWEALGNKGLGWLSLVAPGLFYDRAFVVVRDPTAHLPAFAAANNSCGQHFKKHIITHGTAILRRLGAS
ncbi:predicted protein [Coccidioides posadasii str. Silveira]|uniref:Predicted protein n=1 Tax=Coccidioides posadasii (strain RMSCC 757 / Silveira) TaxID=443226 RepID=E9D530_COCPS|nr:predicted protein [Coccidioides posadasii str. Silveira]